MTREDVYTYEQALADPQLSKSQTVRRLTAWKSDPKDGIDVSEYRILHRHLSEDSRFKKKVVVRGRQVIRETFIRPDRKRPNILKVPGDNTLYHRRQEETVDVTNHEQVTPSPHHHQAVNILLKVVKK